MEVEEEVDEVEMIELLVEMITEDEDVVTETGEGLVLAIELDVDGRGSEVGDLEVGDGVGEDVDGTPAAVLVELDMVNCLKTSFLECLAIAMSAKRIYMVRRLLYCESGPDRGQRTWRLEPVKSENSAGCFAFGKSVERAEAGGRGLGSSHAASVRAMGKRGDGRE